MIEKIYIPTVKRVDNQITFNMLPDELKKKVTLVVQAWEADQYKYDCNYLVLPDTHEYHYTNEFGLANTRLLIYKTAGPIKYAMLDDDLGFGRRNTKYFDGPNNLPGSQRDLTPEEILGLFDMMDSWLDEPEVSLGGLAHIQNRPGSTISRYNTTIASAFWFNGADFAHEDLDTWGLTATSTSHDINMVLTLLTKGYGNKCSEEFYFKNQSIRKKNMESVLWNHQDYEKLMRTKQTLAKKFPGIYNILYDDNGQLIEGGFRNTGRVRVYYNKAYQQSKKRIKND
jgi:hypothetical protein